MNDFIIGLFIGLSVGMVFGMFFITLLTISNNNDLEGEEYEEDHE